MHSLGYLGGEEWDEEHWNKADEEEDEGHDETHSRRVEPHTAATEMKNQT